MKWEDAMWAELEEMDPLARHVACGEWITMMQQEIVPALSVRRRLDLVDAAIAYEHDYLLIAEMIGSRKATVERLVNEGRAYQREQEQRRLRAA